MSEVVYAEGIGQISSWSDAHGSSQYTMRLVGAVLSGIVYGDTILTSVKEASQNLTPSTIQLFQNYPNPFNAQTTFHFLLNNKLPAWVRLHVYDMTGNEVITLLDQELPDGAYEVKWNTTDKNGKPAASGIYFCRLSVGQMLQIKKLVLLR
jgi:hypothetical protein